jgi:alanine-synthesizing transaminase
MHEKGRLTDMVEIETENRVFPLQKRMPKYLASAVEEMKQKALILRECSPDSLMDFGIGNPGQEAPSWILDTMIEEAGKIGASGYMPSHGIPELRESISSWYLHRHGVSLDFEQEAIVTIGSKEGISHLALALVRAGDTVIVPDPAYPVHAQGFEIAGANIRRVPLQTPAQFLFDLEEEIVKGPDRPIRALVLNFPCNPSGCCVELSFFEKIVELAVKHSFWVIHDFAYADLVFDEYRAPSILQVQGAKEVAVEFFTMSKSYNMAGWRVGFMCGNAKLVAALKHVKPYFDYGMYRPIQYAASVALKYGGHYVAQVRDTYQRRRDVLVAGLRSCGWDVSPPQGGMFVWGAMIESGVRADYI